MAALIANCLISYLHRLIVDYLITALIFLTHN